MNLKQGYELDDVLIVPKPSCVVSRESVDLSTTTGSLKLQLPIIASPMEGIVGKDFLIELGRLGGIGILHRFFPRTMDGQLLRRMALSSLELCGINFGFAVGLDDQMYIPALHSGASIICIDVANGYLDSVIRFTSEIADYSKANDFACELMVGNVATYEGAYRLYNAGASIIRTGIGSGQLCTTRNNTGVGVPQATAILDCSYESWYNRGISNGVHSDWKVVADGGIKNSGDATKALALGADYVMLGTLLSNCYESIHEGRIRGMASRELQEQFYGEVKKSVEGIERSAKKRMSLEEFITEFIWNIKSGFTYSNSRNILELHENAEFILTGSGSIVQK